MADVRDVSALQVRSTMTVVAEPTLCWAIRNDDGLLVEPVHQFVAETWLRTAPRRPRGGPTAMTRCAGFGSARRSGPRGIGRPPRTCGTSCGWLRAAPNSQRVRSGKGSRPPAGSVNAATGKTYLREGYSPRTINHALSVLSAFYTLMYESGRGPWSPVPAPQRRRDHVPMRRVRYRQKVPIFQPRPVTEAALQRPLRGPSQ